MDAIEKITMAIEPSLDAMGYTLVQLRLGDSGGKKTLTVMAERHDETPMGMEDCVEISRQVGALLEVEDPISGAYDLEVSSPGIDRPLTRLKDYERYAGSPAKLETFAPIDGRKRFKGTLKGVSGNTIRIATENGEVEIAFSDIRNAKLTISDTLLKKASNRG